jgi:hypothetical protein
VDAVATRDRPPPLTQETPAVALPGGALVVCLNATAIVMASPRLLFGVHEPAVHLVLDTIPIPQQPLTQVYTCPVPMENGPRLLNSIQKPTFRQHPWALA